MKYKLGEYVTIVSLHHSFIQSIIEAPYLQAMLGNNFPISKVSKAYNKYGIKDYDGFEWDFYEKDLAPCLIYKLEALLE